MRAAIFTAPGQIDVAEVPDPGIVEPTDAIVRVEAAGVCGSDLWTYRGQSSAAPGSRIGHEFVGTVEEVGSQVSGLAVGDWVIAPFRYSDGTCSRCREGLPSSCRHGGFWGRDVVEAGQAEYVRVPLAGGTLVRVGNAGERPPASLVPALLSLADVMCTGHHAAITAGVSAGSTTAIIGDGAVGLCAVIAARMLGAERVVVFASSHEDRQRLAAELGADDVIALRGQAAVESLLDLTDGDGAHQVLECVGTPESFDAALGMLRPGGALSYVGIPHGVSVGIAPLFARNVTIIGGMAPARHYIPGLLPEVLHGRIDPGAVFTSRLALTDVARAYELMDSRQTIKTLLAPAPLDP